jgi:hypothetical protein
MVWHERPSIAFERADGFVRVDRDQQSPSQLFGGMKIAHVSDMEQIEAAVSESDLVAGGTPFGHLRLQLAAIENFISSQSVFVSFAAFPLRSLR